MTTLRRCAADELINAASEARNAEMTAWLLEYKKIKFGCKGDDDYEL